MLTLLGISFPKVLHIGSQVRHLPSQAYSDEETRVRSVHALDRKIIEWRYLVDWNLQRQRPMVVVDPNDPEALMYLSERDYRDLQRVCLSNDLPLTVVARKGTVAPTGYNGELGTSPGTQASNSVANKNTSKAPTNQNTPPYPTSAGSRFIKSGLWAQVRGQRAWLPTRVSSLGMSRTPGLVDLYQPVQLLQLLMMWGRQVLHYLEMGRPGYRMVLIAQLSRHLCRIWKTQGLSRMVALMKIYIFVVYSYLGGDPLKSTEALGVRVKLSNGLPRCFPVDMRNQLRTGSRELIRWWVSILNAYKVLRTKYDVEGVLNSITAPPFTGNIGYWSERMLSVWTNLSAILKYVPEYKGGFAYGRYSPKAGPNARVAYLGVTLDALAWCKSHNDVLFRLAKHWAPELSNLLYTDATGANDPALFKKPARPSLAKIGFIFEPAGKVRPVAMLDIWTQWLLYPFHEFLFGILKRIPTDATFDQIGVLEGYVGRLPADSQHYCYDLKNATDRIPLILYVEMFIPLLGRKVAELWAELMTKRDFVVPKIPDDVEVFKEVKLPERVRYSRGQPMGAYSSWASLALVHHFLVQVAAGDSGHKDWFMDYLVLGDDLVITNKEVAQAYLRLCEMYGITVGLAKSFTSKGLINFASKTYLARDNVSPLSLREELTSQSWSARVAIATRVMHLWYKGDTSGLRRLRRMVSNVSWTLLQPELQAQTRGGLLQGLQLLEHNPLAVPPEKFNSDLIRSWLDTYVLNRTDKPIVVTEKFSRDLVMLFARKAETIAKQGLEASATFLDMLENSFEKLALTASYQMGPGLYLLMVNRALKFAGKCENMHAAVLKLIEQIKPVTKVEVTKAQGQFTAPDLKDPRVMAVQMKAFSKAFKKMMYPKGVTPTVKGQALDKHLAKEQLLSQFLPKVIDLWVEALKWSVVPLARLKGRGVWSNWSDLDRFGLAEAPRRGPVLNKYKPYFMECLADIHKKLRELGPTAEFVKSLPEGWTLRSVKVSATRTEKVLSYLVPDFLKILAGPTDPLGPDAYRLPVLELEELCLRHFGAGLGLPELVRGPSVGRRDSDRLLRALSAYAVNGPPKAIETRESIEDPELRLLASQIDYLYRLKRPASSIEEAWIESYLHGFSESPTWSEKDAGVWASGSDPATYQRHWFERIESLGPTLYVATAVAAGRVPEE